jgi:hypothetical protein
MTRTAPNIQDWLDACDKHGLLWHQPMKKELRALLAVARAVTRESEEFVSLARVARGAAPGELDGDMVGRRLEDIADRLGQKTARLAKVSR